MRTTHSHRARLGISNCPYARQHASDDTGAAQARHASCRAVVSTAIHPRKPLQSQTLHWSTQVPRARLALGASWRAALSPSALLRILKLLPELLIALVLVHHIDVVTAEQRIPDHEGANTP